MIALKPYKTNTEIFQVTESGDIETNCLSISFKVKPGTGASVEINGFPMIDGDPMLSDNNDFPGINVTKYRVRFITPGILIVIRKLLVGEDLFPVAVSPCQLSHDNRCIQGTKNGRS